jgi:hypothetical protein
MNSVKKTISSVSLLLFAALTGWADSDDTVYVHRDGAVVYKDGLENIDSLRVDATGTLQTFKSDAMTYSAKTAEIDSITFHADQAQPVLRFASISDTHFENNMGEGARVKVPKSLKNIVSKQPLVDAIIDVGDITDNGTAAQYQLLMATFDDKSIIPESVGRYFLLGNHDNAVGHTSAKTLFEQYVKQPIHQYFEIKGFPFITISQTGTGNYDYNTDAVKFLDASLEDAAVKYPGKPIFVFFHVPPYNTCYGSRSQDGWGGSVLTPSLEKYPQVITFSGHSHFPLGDPRSIHQDKFTAVNDGSTTYSEVESGVVGEGIHPAGYQYVTEAVIVNVFDNGDVEMERWDTYRDEEILPRWTLKAPHDGTNFIYANRDGLPAPVFDTDAMPTVTNITWSGCTIAIPQATDNENVFRYKIEVCRDTAIPENWLETPVISRYVFSQFYFNSHTPDTITQTIDGLEEETEYFVRVYAADSWNNLSKLILSEKFTTAERIKTPPPAAKGIWTFDDPANLTAATIGANLEKSGTGFSAVKGPTTDNGAVRIERGSFFKLLHGFAATTGSGLVGRYSLQIDFSIPQANIWHCFLQTDLSNTSDGDLFINPSGNTIGVGAITYNGSVTANRWYRLIVVFDAGRFIDIYLDGLRINHFSIGGDERFALNPAGLLLFADQDGEDNTIDVAEIRIWDEPLEDYHAKEIGEI